MAGKLPEEEIAEYKEAFGLYDTNGDGYINADELKTIMCSLGIEPTDHEIDCMIKEVDTDNDKKINFTEFLAMMSASIQKTKKAVPNDLLSAFKIFDKNGDGFITFDELKQTMKSMGEEMSDKEIDEMFHSADTNHDQKISYDEFLALMTTKK